jgi:peroxiredoxin
VGGLIIVRDPIEGRLALPRTYGVDDIPLVLTSRRFYADGQFSYQGDRDKYGDYLLVNGTLDAQVNLPAQFVRLRILNAEIERGYNLGFSDHRTFYVIATDGGLVDKPIPVTRLKLMVGERVELLVDLSGDRPGSSVDLLSFNANQPFGFPGGEPGRGRPNGGFLNNLDFRVLHLNVTAPTASRITKLPEVLTRNRFWTEADVTNRRSLRISGGGPPAREFSFDGKYFDMKFTNSVVKLGATEAWTIANDRIFGHSFHIHDIQFKIVSRSDGPVADYEQGWKDTLYLPRGASATFITRFDDYASDTDPFMYHCHMANHEDGGLMGQFLVSRDPAAIKSDGLGMIRLRDCFQYPLTASLVTAAAQLVQTKAPVFQAEDLAGRPVGVGASQDKPLVLFFIDQNCPCARSATPYLIALQNAYGASFVLVGITNGNTEAAQEWAKSTGANFPIIADPGLAISTAYHAERAASTVVVAPGGRISRAWPGFSAPMLRELGKSVAALAGVPERSLSVEGAPVDYVIGCPLFPSELEPVTSTQIVPAASITAANRYAR